ncbi:MAG: hypothetical protein AAGL24_21140 [Pseudomonadota bacterium]
MDAGHYRTFVAKLQPLAEAEIAQVGGYWPVNVAMANVIEELGYAAERLADDDLDGCASYMGYALWVLACVANQYCCDLGRCVQVDWGEDVKDDADVKSSLLLAFKHCGSILRIANRYENDIYTDHKENESIGVPIARAHAAIIKGVESIGADLDELVQQRVDLVRSFRGTPDIPNSPRFDPTVGDSLIRFRNVAGTTACPFAKTAKVWVTEPWRPGVSAEGFVSSAKSTFERFSRVCQSEGFDGIVVERFGINDVDELRAETKALMIAIGRYSHPNPLSRPIEKKEWKFFVFGVDSFVTIFSSVYPTDHPRFSHSQGSTFYFFQPQISFKAKAAKEKDSIRERFAAVDQDYRPLLRKVRFEAQKYIKPIDLQNDDPIVWWKDEED